MTGVTGSFAKQQRTWPTSVIEGRAPGYTYIQKFGRNPDIDPGSTPEDVWNGGGLYTGQPVNPGEPIEGFSSDIADVGQTIRSWGLKTSDDTQESFVDWTLDGQTPVLIDGATAWYRIYRSEFLTGPANVGAVTIRHTVTTANVFAVMPIGAAQTLIAAFTVPADSKLMIENLWVAIARASGALGSSNVVLARRRFGSGVYNHIRSFDLHTGGPIPPISPLPIEIEAKADVIIRILDISDLNTFVSAQFDGYVKRNAA